MMQRLAAEAQADPVIYTLARTIVRQVPGKDHAGEAAALYHWVQAHITYRWDPRAHESLQTPINTLRLQTGDCDDMTTLIIALAESLGLKTRMVVGGWQRGEYVHVWPEIGARCGWIPLDATERRGPGWRAQLPYLMSAEETH